MAAAVLSTLLARASTRTRRLLALAVVLAAASRLGLVQTALAAQARSATLVAALAVAVFVVYALERAVGVAARTAVECDLHRMSARALLEGDVLDACTQDSARVVWDGLVYGRSLLGTMFPTLAADGLAALVILPILAGRVPPSVLGLGVGALVVVAAGVLAVRQTTRRLEERSLEAYRVASDTLQIAIEGKLEVVAHGAEDALTKKLDRDLGAYSRLSVKASWGTALLGRAPLAAATIAIGIAVALDESLRETFGATLVAHALLLAACIPTVMGIALSAHGLARAVVFVRPFVDLLTAPTRADVSCPGEALPALPATFHGEALAFRYAPGEAPVLRGLGFDWTAEAPLVLHGPNGSGKSTLLRVLLGLRPPTSGEVRVGGVALGAIDARALRRRIAYLPQRPWLGDAHVAVRAALAFAGEPPPEPAMRRALERVHLLDALTTHAVDPLDVRVGELSAGQRQRLALARVLLADAHIVMLDEPDANLDADGVALVASLARELVREGKMVAVAAHSAELVGLSGSSVAFERL